MELVEMQNFFGLKSLFNQGRSSAFCKTKCAVLQREAFKVLAVFGTTYTCECVFSTTNSIETKKLTEEDTEECAKVK
jgi:hypothetical protein